MIDRILVATDLSTRSDRALRRAILIARRVGASLSLVHVVDSDLPARMVEAERAAAAAILNDAVETIRDGDGVDAEARVVADDVPSGILDAADEIDARLIVLGPHRTRFRDVFVGTTVERIVRRSRRPVLVAVQPPAADYRRTLLAMDFDEGSKAAARAALAMGAFEHTDVTLIHAFDAPAARAMRRAMESPDEVEAYVAVERRRAAERLRDLVAELGLPPSDRRIAPIEGTPARSLVEAAASEAADLLVMGTNKRKGFERLLIGSVTENVLRDVSADVMIVPVDVDLP